MIRTIRAALGLLFRRHKKYLGVLGLTRRHVSQQEGYVEYESHQNTDPKEFFRNLRAVASFVPSVYCLFKGVKEICTGMSTNTGL